MVGEKEEWGMAKVGEERGTGGGGGGGGGNEIDRQIDR